MWENLTLGQYLQMYDIEQSKNINELEKQLRMMCVIENKKEEDYDRMKYLDFLEHLKKVTDELRSIPDFKPVDYITVNGNRYKFVHEIKEITAGQFIDFNHFSNDIMNLHKTAAVFFLGMKGDRVCAYGEIPHDKIAEDLLDAKFSEIQGCLLFFYHLTINSILTMQTYSEQEMKIHKQIMDNSLKFGVGTMILN
jgi:hypothetical protein